MRCKTTIFSVWSLVPNDNNTKKKLKLKVGKNTYLSLRYFDARIFNSSENISLQDSSFF